MSNNREDVVNEYSMILANIQTDYINAIGLGIIQEDCHIPLYSILIHCIKNIEIFNENQSANIFNYLNKLNYGE